MGDARVGAVLSRKTLPARGIGITLPPVMVPHMVCELPYLDSNAQIRRRRISLPLVECLLDNEKYFLPGDLAAKAPPPPFRPNHKKWRPSNLAEVYRLIGLP